MKNTTTLANYMSVLGMYELRQNIKYTVYNESVNENLFAWKEYSKEVRTNAHSMAEFKLDLSDVTFLGTSDSLEP